jgi:1-acyl-sn-glycerol-3-phosphate acyltransferase
MTSDRRGVLQRIIRFLANLVYRDIDVAGTTADLRSGPILAVSNHFGGLADGVLLVDSLPRMPRVVARDVIWRVPVVGRLATALGGIPVHKPQDGAGKSNDQMFATAYRALGDGDLVLIFPEGVTMDAPHMAQVRTGAARMVLGAQASGVAGIRVLPVGVHYEDKAGFRSRVLVNIGDPIELDRWSATRGAGTPPGADDRDAVDDLTEVIDGALRHVAPDFPDWPTVEALQQAGEVLLQDVAPAPQAQLRYGDVELLAARLHRVQAPAGPAIVSAAQEYRAALRSAGTSDKAVAISLGAVRRGRSWRWLRDLFLVLVLLPFAVAGLLATLIPVLVVGLVSKLRVAPAVRATLVPGVALLMFGAEWAWLMWSLGRSDGWDASAVGVLLFPFFVAAMFVTAELSALLWHRWRARRAPSAAQLPHLQQLRGRLAELAWGAL